MKPIKLGSLGAILIVILIFLSAWLAICVPVRLIVLTILNKLFSTPNLPLSASALDLQEALATAAAGLFGSFLVISEAFGRKVKIPVGHRAVFVKFGTRCSTPILDEGVYWLPPFCDTINYDCRQTTHQIPPTEVLSLDSVPVRYTVQIQTKIADPYLRSGLDDPTASITNYAADAIRIVLSKHSALEIAAASEALCSEIASRLSPSTAASGLEVVGVMASDIRLPKEIEQYAQVLRIVRSQHPDVSAEFLITAFQAQQGAFKKIVYESDSLSAAVSRIAELILKK